MTWTKIDIFKCSQHTQFYSQFSPCYHSNTYPKLPLYIHEHFLFCICGIKIQIQKTLFILGGQLITQDTRGSHHTKALLQTLHLYFKITGWKIQTWAINLCCQCLRLYYLCEFMFTQMTILRKSKCWWMLVYGSQAVTKSLEIQIGSSHHLELQVVYVSGLFVLRHDVYCSSLCFRRNR